MNVATVLAWAGTASFLTAISTGKATDQECFVL